MQQLDSVGVSSLEPYCCQNHLLKVYVAVANKVFYLVNTFDLLLIQGYVDTLNVQ
jgi:uncharacterized Fe-S cluster-containing radical SAM superfamily protein